MNQKHQTRRPCARNRRTGGQIVPYSILFRSGSDSMGSLRPRPLALPLEREHIGKRPYAIALPHPGGPFFGPALAVNESLTMPR